MLQVPISLLEWFKAVLLSMCRGYFSYHATLYHCEIRDNGFL